MTSRLANIEAKQLKESPLIIVVGPEGIGKTTLVTDAPKTILIDANGGSGRLKVKRYPFTDNPKRGHIPTSYEAILAAIKDLTESDHDYQTLAIDGLDDVEKLLHAFILERDKPKAKERSSGLTGIMAYHWNKGPEIALNEWIVFTKAIHDLRIARDMTVVATVHQTTRRFKSPTTEDYDKFVMRINELAASYLREQAQIVAQATFEDLTTDLLGPRAKGVDTGRRLLKFRRTATFDGKSRYNVPDEVEIPTSNPWAPLAKALSDAQDMTAEQLIAAIEVELIRINDDLVSARARDHIKSANGDTETLQRVLGAAREKQSSNEEGAK